MTKNYTGLPCRAKTYCPTGSAVERDCLAGYYCPETSSSLTICPGEILILLRTHRNKFSWELFSLIVD